jgi:hypothetical protein
MLQQSQDLTTRLNDLEDAFCGFMTVIKDGPIFTAGENGNIVSVPVPYEMKFWFEAHKKNVHCSHYHESNSSND